MKILYLTTARHPKDYERFLSQNRIAPNPSNQNFHTKLIDLLSKFETLKVLSSRPMSKDLFLKEQQKEHYFYPAYVNLPIIKRVGIFFGGHKLLTRFKPDYLFVDVMNQTLLHLARKLKQYHQVKVIGIVTDNPINITGTKKSYSESIFKLSQTCDAFITLTDGLNQLFNPTLKPSLTIPGFISETIHEPFKKEEYAFFAGALYNRYGVGELIETFKNNNHHLKLLVVGHGPLGSLLTQKSYPNIEFLGQVSPEIAFQLSKKALVNINPRPVDTQIDKYSVPSKMLDYINSGTITISTQNSEIKKLVGDDVYWLKDNLPESINQALQDIQTDFDLWTTRAKRAKRNLETSLSSKEMIVKIKDLMTKI